MDEKQSDRRWGRRQWLGGSLLAAVGLPLATSALGSMSSVAQDAQEPTPASSPAPRQQTPNPSPSSNSPEPRSSGQGNQRSEQLAIEIATVLPDQEVLVPAPVTGRIAKIFVQQNNNIAASTVIASIDDRKAQIALKLANARLEAATLEASDDSAIKEAEASRDLALNNNRRQIELNRQDVTSDEELEASNLELTQAELKLTNRQKQFELAQKRLQVAQLEVEDAQQQIELHKIVAPSVGNVIDILKHEGEWINEGEPLVKLVNMEWLRVEGSVDNRIVNREDIYMRRVIVEHQRAHGMVERFEGLITWEGLREVAGQQIPVRAMVRNRTNDDHWILHPGARVRMIILEEHGSLAELESTVR